MPRGALKTVALGLVWLVGGPALAAQDDEVLARARELYNEGRFAEVIAAVEAARSDESGGSDEAALVVARARLERFRVTQDLSDLVGAREELRRINPAALSAQDFVAWEMGVAEALFFEQMYRPAAELFAGLLERRQAGPPGRERLLDWWATAVERHAEADAEERRAAYERVLDRMETELRQNPRSASAAYWVAAAARALGDLDRAWDAVVVGWIRAAALEHRLALRQDLDRLMLQAVIPERAVRQTGAPSDTPEAIAAMAEMVAVWESIKERWTDQLPS